MTDINIPLRQFLSDRESRLVELIGRLRDQLTPLENELAEVRRASASIGMGAGTLTLGDAKPYHSPSAEALAAEAVDTWVESNTSDRQVKPLLANLYTIKQLVLTALDAHFKNGATTQQIREFIRDAYKRDIDRSSLTPQLSRLAQESSVQRDSDSEFWRITTQGRRLIRRYTHHTSWEDDVVPETDIRAQRHGWDDQKKSKD